MLGTIIGWAWTALQFIIVFLLVLWALVALTKVMYRDTRPGDIAAWTVLLLALTTAYVVVINPPLDSECIESTPQGSGRC